MPGDIQGRGIIPFAQGIPKPPEPTVNGTHPLPESEDINPLDTGKADSLKLGWIDDYTHVMTALTGSPAEFNRLAAIVIAASVLQRKARVCMSFGDIYPNVYACIIARSSVYHKSSTINQIRKLLNRANLEHLLLSELMTSEGLLAQLNRQSAGVVLRDEIGTLFDSNNMKYLRNLKPDITALYDCYPYSRALSNETIKVDKPYLNILGATTPARFYEGTTQTDWIDGFLVRWLFVLPHGEPDFDATPDLYSPKHDNQIAELIAPLQAISRYSPTNFIFEGEALDIWNKWQKYHVKDAYFYDDDIVSAVVTRYSAYALKFSIILTALNSQWGKITTDTMQIAIDLADSYKSYVYRILAEKGAHQVTGGKLQKVFVVIKRKNQENQGEGATISMIQAFSHLNKSQLTPCLEKLIEVGAITEENSGRGKRYRPAVEDLPVKNWK